MKGLFIFTVLICKDESPSWLWPWRFFRQPAIL